MLDDGPTLWNWGIDLALQEYYRPILNTIEWLTANGKAENTSRQAIYAPRWFNFELN